MLPYVTLSASKREDVDPTLLGVASSNELTNLASLGEIWHSRSVGGKPQRCGSSAMLWMVDQEALTARLTGTADDSRSEVTV
jgi:hypothetical protein